MNNYRDELQALHHRRVNYIVLGGSVMTLLFALLDYVTIPELFLEFLNYRFLIAVLGIVLFLINLSDKKKRFSFFIGFTGYISVVCIILLMIYQVGGVLSPYYVGLIVAVALYVTLAPLTVIQTLAAGGFLVAGYIVTILSSQPVAGPYALELFSNLFFMICFILIIATQSWAETAARKSEYLLRKEEDYATSELSRHAEMLEVEVKKRSAEQGALEKRYRQLFNQIADHVVLLSPDGKIVQANNRFNQFFSPAKTTKNRLFWDIVAEDDNARFQKVFRDVVISKVSLSNGKFTLKAADGTHIEMEVSGNVITRHDVPHAVLLLMRDLSIRKEMELQLIKSLEVKKKTETSAILVLAKLSEFRDVTPDFHLERIREYCKLLAIELSGLAEFKGAVTSTFIEDIYHASILHDIGKVAIPDEYMAGDAPYVEYEKDLIRRHTLIGGDVIREMEAETEGGGFLTMAKRIAYFHHERWDGKGYPYGLAKRETPLAARIMAVADAYEEITTSSDLEAESLHSSAVTYISENSGSQFDPQIVSSFLAIQSQVNDIRRAYPFDSPEPVT